MGVGVGKLLLVHFIGWLPPAFIRPTKKRPKLYCYTAPRKFIAEELGLGSWKTNFLFWAPA